MSLKTKFRHIVIEFKGHVKFTAFGALTGIFFVLIFRDWGRTHANILFGIFHPGHVLLSAMVTASIFTLHKKVKNFLIILIIGYVGSVGITTLSDSVIPYIGESLLNVHIPTHADVHTAEDNISYKAHEGESREKEPSRIHLGFIEDWYIVNPAALLGVFIAYFIPRTKFPHAGHILISTWASSSHILMNVTGDITFGIIIAIFGILFISVWVPCCVSDIVFPLLFVKSDIALAGVCPVHKHHSHAHIHDDSEVRA
ncbi:MAG: hypothetical protein ACYSSL_05595 [Planctomycetota bacterium]|jgi:hypothetical protein